MKLYSQRDPAYSSLKLGSTTVYRDGCVVCSLATLFQVDPTIILEIPKAFNSRGESEIKVIVDHLGGHVRYRGVKKPVGWCLAKTAYYKGVGVPTHFFCYNPQTLECIDPLQNPSFRQTCIYPISEYIWIDNIKIDFAREDAEGRLKIAEYSLHRLGGLRKSSVMRFIERLKNYLT